MEKSKVNYVKEIQELFLLLDKMLEKGEVSHEVYNDLLGAIFMVGRRDL